MKKRIQNGTYIMSGIGSIRFLWLAWVSSVVWLFSSVSFALPNDLGNLRRDQVLAHCRVVNLYSGPGGGIVGAKFVHLSTGAPLYFFQLETVPEMFTWVEAPVDSNRGLPHSLEHLLFGKGTRGRYFHLLADMRLSGSGAGTRRDYVHYNIASGDGVSGFFELLDALLQSLYRPDFTDIEAEREFYHFGVSTQTIDGQVKRTLVEKGTVYNEMLSREGRSSYFFGLNKRVLGDQNPLAFESAGFPDAMRDVKVSDIRQFHDRFYRIGPTTGFIFVFPPEASVPLVLRHISEELTRFSRTEHAVPVATPNEPKYPIASVDQLDPGMYPYPGPNDSSPGVVYFGWKPAKAESLLDLTLLRLFAHSLSGGENSLLHKALVDSATRSVEVGATGVNFDLYLNNSPRFPFLTTEVSGIPGNQISAAEIEQLRSVVVKTIREVSEYPDHSERLAAFSRSVASYADSLRRSERVSTQSPPGFEFNEPRYDWKEHLECLEMDPSFVRSLTEEPVWQAVEQRLKSGRNIWRDVIHAFGLAETPYATAGMPSRSLLEEMEQHRNERLKTKIQALLQEHHSTDEQSALSAFEQDELVKTKELEQIDAKVTHPHFTDHPPLTADDGVRQRQFTIDGVPAIATFFSRAPTIDVGFTFDLHTIPRKYYRYLPLLPRSLDSLGLKESDHPVPYADLSDELQRTLYSFSSGFEVNAPSKRADFAIRLSATTPDEVRGGLRLLRRLMRSTYLDPSNADRLRDIVAARIADDGTYPRQDASSPNASYSFRNQSDPFILAIHSRFTGAHQDERLRWLLHKPVDRGQLLRLDSFSNDTVARLSGMSRTEVTKSLNGLGETALEKELVAYWKKNLYSFPSAELASGLQRLSKEVHDDLAEGPDKTIQELKELQRLVFNSQLLHLDVMLSKSRLTQLQPEIAKFVASLPSFVPSKEVTSEPEIRERLPLTAKLEKRYGISMEHFPWYVGFVNSDHLRGDVLFSADFPDYAQIDHDSAVRVVASKLFSGAGPHTFETKTSVAGLAYNNGIFSDPSRGTMWYIANRIPEIPVLVTFVNSTAGTISQLHDPSLAEYALSHTFTFSRSMLTFSERGKALALDVRDGNTPDKIQKFSEAVLNLRHDPDLFLLIRRSGISAICGVLLTTECKAQQASDRSLFFFAGSEQVLAGVEKQLPVSKFVWLWPSDFWLQ